MQDIKTIKEAVIKNRGGWETATDQEIMTIWQSLDAETQKKYMETLTTETPRKKEIK